jgi:hydrogenase-4 component B
LLPMYKLLIECFNLIAVATIICIPFLNTKNRGILTFCTIILQAILVSSVGFHVFVNGSIVYNYPGSWITGTIPVRIDYLSVWFILVFTFTFVAGAWFGLQYMKEYSGQTDNIALHAIAFILVYTSMVDICLVQNSFVMLVFWEIMAIGSFVLIIFEHYKSDTLRAGINFLIQSHVCILLLTIGFIWVRVKTGTFDYNAITTYTSLQPPIIGIGLFVIFFFGFAIKAGFVPFHTWLPLAHPEAPAHISGIMSGVIIKIGIYGIMRILMLIKTDITSIGYFIIFISVITGLYGVMLAIVQHNLKKMLAYHSIENIGIIGIGIGLGCLGMGYNNQILIITGFGGALLHTLNHSLFKSLLFYCAGNVYQCSHNMIIDKSGGLIQRIPHSAYLFLIGSLAICGLPPFNGFVSEFFIYSGLFKGLLTDHFMLILFLLFVILGLVVIGGMALMCFTKAFGMMFLGSPREKSKDDLFIENNQRIFPLYLIAVAILFIGLFPFLFSPFLLKTINLYQVNIDPATYMQSFRILDNLTVFSLYSLGFIVLFLIFYALRVLIIRKRETITDNTWGCGYVGETDKMQYTGSSYIRSYRKLAEPFLFIKKKKRDAYGLYPGTVEQATQPEDKIENWFINKPLHLIKSLLNRFVFLQNGNIQTYLLYGFIFIGLIILLPIIIHKISALFAFINQL